MSPCVFSILVILWPVMAVELSTLEGQQILQALHCPPCERIHCSPRQALKLQCQGGIATGICGCCPACAKLAGESCGGTWDYLGKCDEGLVCIYPEETDGKPEAERKGTCKSVSLMNDRFSAAGLYRWRSNNSEGFFVCLAPTCPTAAN
ncbi:hypothetical protein cypCar_00041770 [Cyprinus carpio]|nr:hypothetical protein cypCar_00041770 [Cyprinus carpio]